MLKLQIGSQNLTNLKLEHTFKPHFSMPNNVRFAQQIIEKMPEIEILKKFYKHHQIRWNQL